MLVHQCEILRRACSWNTASCVDTVALSKLAGRQGSYPLPLGVPRDSNGQTRPRKCTSPPSLLGCSEQGFTHPIMLTEREEAGALHHMSCHSPVPMYTMRSALGSTSNNTRRALGAASGTLPGADQDGATSRLQASHLLLELRPAAPVPAAPLPPQ